MNKISFLNEKYNSMVKYEDEYFDDLITKIREELYGFNVSLDIISPYNDFDALYKADNAHERMKNFAYEIKRYYYSYYEDCTKEELFFVENLVLLVFYFIRINLPRVDYIFNAFVVVIKTFYLERYENEDYKIKDSWLWKMIYIDYNEFEGDIEVFENYTKEYLDNIFNNDLGCKNYDKYARKIVKIIRLYLFDKNYDYFSDEALRICVSDFLSEDLDSLQNIYLYKKKV